MTQAKDNSSGMSMPWMKPGMTSSLISAMGSPLVRVGKTSVNVPGQLTARAKHVEVIETIR